MDIARRIVSLIDGQVDFDSVMGRTEFRVSLPIAEPVASSMRAHGVTPR